MLRHIVDGKCDEGWRHYNGKCYKFETSSMTFQKSKEFCQQNNGMLTSILDENEQSFLVGSLLKNSLVVSVLIRVIINGQNFVVGTLYFSSGFRKLKTYIIVIVN